MLSFTKTSAALVLSGAGAVKLSSDAASAPWFQYEKSEAPAVAIPLPDHGMLPMTVIGSYPKPAEYDGTDWFKAKSAETAPGGGMSLTKAVTDQNSAILSGALKSEDQHNILTDGMKAWFQEQESLGIYIPGDGEMGRENYIYALLRNCAGVNFETLTEVNLRGVHVETVPSTVDVPTLLPEEQLGQHVATPVQEFLRSKEMQRQAAAEMFQRSNKQVQESFVRDVKITLPGPMTICDSHSIKPKYEEDYDGYKAAVTAYAVIVKEWVRRLVAAGAKNIQIDEPVFSRETRYEAAIDYGIDLLDDILSPTEGTDVTTTVHICLGYPMKVDHNEYEHAQPKRYEELAPKLDATKHLHWVALEDGGGVNRVELFQMFTRKTVEK